MIEILGENGYRGRQKKPLSADIKKIKPRVTRAGGGQFAPLGKN